MSKKDEWQNKYNQWWKGKLIKIYELEVPRRVARVKLIGPPSFVYGAAEFVFEDGSTQLIPTNSYKPRKSDVIVIEESI